MRIVKKKKGKKRRRKKSKENCQHPIAIHRRRAEKSNAENEETNDECVCVYVDSSFRMEREVIRTGRRTGLLSCAESASSSS